MYRLYGIAQQYIYGNVRLPTASCCGGTSRNDKSRPCYYCDGGRIIRRNSIRTHLLLTTVYDRQCISECCESFLKNVFIYTSAVFLPRGETLDNKERDCPFMKVSITSSAYAVLLSPRRSEHDSPSILYAPHKNSFPPLHSSWHRDCK